jgi:hypothetical protein
VYDRLYFGGTPSDPATAAYAEMMDSHGAEHVGGIRDALRYLDANYPAEWRDLWHVSDAEDQSAEPVSNYRAVVNPEWEGADPDDLPPDRDDAVWYVPTTKYTLVPHVQALGPLVEAMERVDAGEIFGSVRTRRDGGETHVDVFFQNTDLGVASDDEITLGISTGNDYFGSVSLYVDVIAFLSPAEGDGRVMRYLVDEKSRKHTGAAREDAVDFYESAVRQLSDAAGDLREVVANAMSHTLPMGDLPASHTELFAAIGLPDRAPSKVATPAGDRLVGLTPVGENPTAWHVYKAGLWALEHSYDARDTSTFEDHITTVNTWLFNPALAEKRLLSALESRLGEVKTDPDRELTDHFEGAGESATTEEYLESVRARDRTISGGVAEIEGVRERIESLLTDEGTTEAIPDSETAESESDGAASDGSDRVTVESDD